MNNYRLTIQYDGSRYNGWQRLNDTDNTIEQILTDAIIKSTGEKTKLIGSGRTDAGVHALAQTANFRCRQRLDEMHFTEELNSMLPEDIRVNLTREYRLTFIQDILQQVNTTSTELRHQSLPIRSGADIHGSLTEYLM